MAGPRGRERAKGQVVPPSGVAEDGERAVHRRAGPSRNTNFIAKSLVRVSCFVDTRNMRWKMYEVKIASASGSRARLLFSRRHVPLPTSPSSSFLLSRNVSIRISSSYKHHAREKEEHEGAASQEPTESYYSFTASMRDTLERSER